MPMEKIYSIKEVVEILRRSEKGSGHAGQRHIGIGRVGLTIRALAESHRPDANGTGLAIEQKGSHLVGQNLPEASAFRDATGDKQADINSVAKVIAAALNSEVGQDGLRLLDTGETRVAISIGANKIDCSAVRMYVFSRDTGDVETLGVQVVTVVVEPSQGGPHPIHIVTAFPSRGNPDTLPDYRTQLAPAVDASKELIDNARKYLGDCRKKLNIPQDYRTGDTLWSKSKTYLFVGELDDTWILPNASINSSLDRVDARYFAHLAVDLTPPLKLTGVSGKLALRPYRDGEVVPKSMFAKAREEQETVEEAARKRREDRKALLARLLKEIHDFERP
jgi:hypothetical protein